MIPLKKSEIDTLTSLRVNGPIGPIHVNTSTLKKVCDSCERLVDLGLGLATAHRSSIGELTEKATYSITPAGTKETKNFLK